MAVFNAIFSFLWIAVQFLHTLFLYASVALIAVWTLVQKRRRPTEPVFISVRVIAYFWIAIAFRSFRIAVRARWPLNDRQHIWLWKDAIEIHRWMKLVFFLKLFSTFSVISIKPILYFWKEKRELDIGSIWIKTHRLYMGKMCEYVNVWTPLKWHAILGNKKWDNHFVVRA